jgi:uncharacterized protein
MEMTIFGRTQASVSRLGFGGAPAGLTNYLGEYQPTDLQQRRQVIAAIQRAVELGITYFDTAQAYGDGQSEEIFGEALSGVGAPVFLATKVGHWVEEPRRQVEESLKRLRRAPVDLVQIHGTSYPPELVQSILSPGGLLEQLLQMKAEGLVRFIGFTSEDNNPAVYRFIETGKFDALQIAYNFLFQHPAEPTRPFGSLYEAHSAGMGICTMRTLTSGIFQKWIQWVNPDNTFDYTSALLQFVLSNPLVNVALVGMRTPEEVEKNVRICENLDDRIDIPRLHGKYV